MCHLSRSASTLLGLGISLLPHADASTTISGFVTRAGTPETYFVNEENVTCVPASTRLRTLTFGQAPEEHVGCKQWTVGEQLTIEGDRDKKSSTVVARHVEVDRPIPLAVDGFAIVDRVFATPSTGEGSIRADGYLLHTASRTNVAFSGGSGLNLQSVGTNVWVRYAGTLRADGTVDASSLVFSPNSVSSSENNLRKKTEFDASAVNDGDKQSGVGRYFLGVNAKRIPAHHDEAMQQRISSIGEKLIPAFQRDLPDSDPTKIHFRFQLVDEKTLWWLPLTSGIVLVPYQTVSALQSDAQLAAVLAAGIAEVLEEQAVRAIPGNRARQGTSVAGSVAGLFVPGLGVATSVVTSKAQSIAEHHRIEQSTRAALAWMHDAGYDIREAPVAWWTLSDKKGKPLSAVAMPYRTQYAYRVLGTAWRQP